MKSPYMWDIDQFMQEDPTYQDQSSIWAEMQLLRIISEVNTTDPDE